MQMQQILTRADALPSVSRLVEVLGKPSAAEIKHECCRILLRDHQFFTRVTRSFAPAVNPDSSQGIELRVSAAKTLYFYGSLTEQECSILAIVALDPRTPQELKQESFQTLNLGSPVAAAIVALAATYQWQPLLENIPCTLAQFSEEVIAPAFKFLISANKCQVFPRILELASEVTPEIAVGVRQEQELLRIKTDLIYQREYASALVHLRSVARPGCLNLKDSWPRDADIPLSPHFLLQQGGVQKVLDCMPFLDQKGFLLPFARDVAKILGEISRCSPQPYLEQIAALEKSLLVKADLLHCQKLTAAILVSIYAVAALYGNSQIRITSLAQLSRYWKADMIVNALLRQD